MIKELLRGHPSLHNMTNNFFYYKVKGDQERVKVVQGNAGILFSVQEVILLALMHPRYVIRKKTEC